MRLAGKWRLQLHTDLPGECLGQPKQEADKEVVRDISAAKAWRTDALAALRKGTMRAPAQVTLQQESDEWLRLAKQGLVRTKSGDPYKPSTISSYQEALLLHVLPHLGSVRLANVTRVDVQKIADELRASAVVNVRLKVMKRRGGVQRWGKT